MVEDKKSSKTTESEINSIRNKNREKQKEKLPKS